MLIVRIIVQFLLMHAFVFEFWPLLRSFPIHKIGGKLAKKGKPFGSHWRLIRINKEIKISITCRLSQLKWTYLIIYCMTVARMYHTLRCIFVKKRRRICILIELQTTIPAESNVGIFCFFTEKLFYCRNERKNIECSENCIVLKVFILAFCESLAV